MKWRKSLKFLCSYPFRFNLHHKRMRDNMKMLETENTLHVRASYYQKRLIKWTKNNSEP